MHYLKDTSIVLCLIFFSHCLLSTAKSKQPDVIIFLADDLGYADVGFNGSDIQTPNIDKIAQEGIKLERFYVCPVCSPTRAGLMTGRYPLRFGMQRAVVPPQRIYGLSPEEETLPEMLAKAGYKHLGAVGKWHLGHREKQWLPLQQGFTYFVGCYNGAIDYFSLERNGELDWHKNGQPYPQKGYATDLIGDAAIEFIESVPNDEPYFLYVPFNAPHSPFQAKEEDMAKYPQRKGKKQVYAAMVDCMDQNIGRILEAAEKRGNLDNTFILFSSDNGGVKNVCDNSPYRDGKFSPYEGGIRVAAAAKWPDGKIKGGKTISAPSSYVDVFPTLMAVANKKQEAENILDGNNALAVWQGKTGKESSFFTYIDQNPQKVERLSYCRNEWKLVIYRNAPDNPKPYKQIELFNITNDSAEKHNLAEQHPELVKELTLELRSYYQLKREDQVPRYSEKEKLSGPKISNWQPSS